MRNKLNPQSSNVNVFVRRYINCNTQGLDLKEDRLIWFKLGFPMWDRPNQESVVGIGLICKQVASDGRRRAIPVSRGPIGRRAGLIQAR